MFSDIKSLINSGKDSAISFSIKQIINLKAKKVGAYIEDFHIDSYHKNITVTAILENEPEPLTIKALHYIITKKNEKYFLEVDKIQKSRKWENSYIDGKRYKIPPDIVKIVEFLL